MFWHVVIIFETLHAEYADMVLLSKMYCLVSSEIPQIWISHLALITFERFLGIVVFHVDIKIILGHKHFTTFVAGTFFSFVLWIFVYFQDGSRNKGLFAHITTKRLFSGVCFHVYFYWAVGFEIRIALRARKRSFITVIDKMCI